jgi:hypothetical protein
MAIEKGGHVLPFWKKYKFMPFFFFLSNEKLWLPSNSVGVLDGD